MDIECGLWDLEDSQRSKSYRMDQVIGPHDWTHPVRMLEIGKQLENFIKFDPQEFKASVILHNIDRIKAYHDQLNTEGISAICRGLLFRISFTKEAENRIIDAVEKHDKLDSSDDSSLLTALRSADRIDWLGPIGVVGASYIWTVNGMYGDSNPFVLTEEGTPRNFYQDVIRQTEWYAMLPSDDVRSIVDPYLPGRIYFLRIFAAEVAARHNVDNMVERDLKRVFGPYYARWSF